MPSTLTLDQEAPGEFARVVGIVSRHRGCDQMISAALARFIDERVDASHGSPHGDHIRSTNRSRMRTSFCSALSAAVWSTRKSERFEGIVLIRMQMQDGLDNP
ncbi:MAG TPA: hypothetical protein VIU11_07790 [Nakamurella sp.]